MLNRGMRWALVGSAVLSAGCLPAPAQEPPQVTLMVRNFTDRPCPRLAVWTGVPLPRGAVKDASRLRLLDDRDRPVLAQFDVQARWLDGSVQWVLVSFIPPRDTPPGPRRSEAGAGGRSASAPSASTAPAGPRPQTFRLVVPGEAPEPASEPGRGVSVFPDTNCWDVTAGPLKFRLNRQGFCGISQAWLDLNSDGAFDAEEIIVEEKADAGIVVVDRDGQTFNSHHGRVAGVTVERSGPVHAVVAVRGDLRDASEKDPLLNYVARFHAFAGSSLVRVVVTVHNPRAAKRVEDGGRWVLGQGGSVLFKSLRFVQPIRLPEGHRRVSLSPEPGKLFDRIPLAAGMSVYQDSSGGENWFSRTHVNRDNAVPLSFKGYRVFYGERCIDRGLRASPWLDVSDMRWGMSAAVPAFWENFPKSLSADGEGAIHVGLWPEQFGDLHELQGGEQKTSEFWLYFRHRRGGRSAVMPFDREVMPFCLDRPLLLASASSYAQADALDPLVPARANWFPWYEAVVASAVLGKPNLYSHIEEQDEYGWRNFGDTPAYNERDQTQGPYSGLICCSHYNNEYDLGLGMLQQAMRNAGTNWPLARAWHDLAMHALWHEADIDIYHTKDEPYPFYAGGMFTHTAHGVDAGRSTHRASPRDEMYGRLEWPWGRGGAPEAGHFRTRGILTAYLVSGDRHLLEAARDLADCVAFKVGQDKFAQIDIPDRCAGNNLQILLDAYLLDRDENHLRLCEKIVAHLTLEALKKRSGDRAAEQADWSTALYVKSLYRFIRMMADKGVRHDLAIAEHLDYARLLRRPYDRRGRLSGGSWSLLMSEVMMQAADLSQDQAEKEKFLAAAQSAFHGIDGMVRPDGTGSFWNSKTLTMLLQGGGLYMRHAAANGLEGPTTMPATQPVLPREPFAPPAPSTR